MPDPVFDYYSVDASIMIKLKDMLPYDLFEPAWDEISRLVSAGRWKIFENVVDDIHSEFVSKWLADNVLAIVKFNAEINEYISRLMADLQINNMMLVNPMSLKNNTDPFVVMLALYLEKRDPKMLKQNGKSVCCVLTNEQPKPNKTNIPSVCSYYGIPFMNLFDLMRHHRWKISLDVQNP